MKKSRFSKEQIIGILAEQESGMKVSEVCRKHGISDAKRLKPLETENTELKKMVAELSLEAALRKKY